MTHLHTIAVILTVITIIHLEKPIHISMSIRDTLPPGMIAITTPLRLHPLQPDGLKPRRHLSVGNTVTIACKMHPHLRRYPEPGITVLRGTTLRTRHPLTVILTINTIGAIVLKTEVRRSQRTADVPGLLLVLHPLGEMSMTRRLGKNTVYAASSGIDDRLLLEAIITHKEHVGVS